MAYSTNLLINSTLTSGLVSEDYSTLASLGFASDQRADGFGVADAPMANIFGTPGNDTLNGTSANDFIYGYAGNDTINGLGGDDYLYGGEGNDTVSGGDGNDRITIEEGVNTTNGDAGDDYFSIRNKGGGTLNGGAGTDTISINFGEYSETSGVTIDLSGISAGGSSTIGAITVTGIEVIEGGGFNTLTSFADSITIGSGYMSRVLVSAGDGDDFIRSGQGDDLLYGELGSDTIYGGLGDDYIGGYLDNLGSNPGDVDLFSNYLYGEDGNDRISGGGGNDVIDGGDGRDILTGWNGNDTISGGAGDDTINGGKGDDTINGGDGADFIFGEEGINIVDGGAGDDNLVISLGSALAFGGSVEGGAGFDKLHINLDRAAASVNIDLTGLWAGGTGMVGAVSVTGIETITTGGPITVSDFDDTVIVGNNYTQNAAVSGNDGDDFIRGGQGNDSLTGGLGSDTIYGGLGDDTIGGYLDNLGSNPGDVDLFSNYLYGEDGNDRISGGGGNDVIDGGNGRDILTGWNGNDTISGGAGDDTLDGGEGDDIINGGAGNDLLDGGAGNDRMRGNDGDDIYLVEQSGDRVIEGVGEGLDTVNASVSFSLGANIENLQLIGASLDGRGNSAGNVITSGGGEARLFGRGGADTLNGSSGNDRLLGQGDDDILFGNGGDDILAGGDGDDIMNGGHGNDIYYVQNLGDVVTESGGGGIDTVRARVDYVMDDGIEILSMSAAARIGTGNALDNTIFGRGGGDTLSGLAGNDIIRGGNAADIIDGGTGDDLIDGGQGKDIMTGGDGVDKFQFRFANDFNTTLNTADVITDFDQGLNERIQLNAIDANINTGANDAFEWISTNAFSNTAGEMRYQQIAGDTFIEGDTDGDGQADMMVRLTGLYTLDATDIIGASDLQANSAPASPSLLSNYSELFADSGLLSANVAGVGGVAADEPGNLLSGAMSALADTTTSRLSAVSLTANSDDEMIGDAFSPEGPAGFEVAPAAAFEGEGGSSRMDAGALFDAPMPENIALYVDHVI